MALSVASVFRASVYACSHRSAQDGLLFPTFHSRANTRHAVRSLIPLLYVRFASLSVQSPTGLVWVSFRPRSHPGSSYNRRAQILPMRLTS
jgi:hypothetical protein